MSKVVVIGKKQLRNVALVLLLCALAFSFWLWNKAEPAGGAATEPRVIHMVTGEFKSKAPDGSEMEAYRWDPGTIVVKQGENVELRILGMNGDEHPFVIEGLNIRGEIKKGKETVVTFHAKEEGIYRIVCLTHTGPEHNGPMVGYIVVD